MQVLPDLVSPLLAHNGVPVCYPASALSHEITDECLLRRAERLETSCRGLACKICLSVREPDSPVEGNTQELLALAVDDRVPVDQIPDLGTCRPEDLLALVAKVFPDVGTASSGTRNHVACWERRLQFLK